MQVNSHWIVSMPRSWGSWRSICSLDPIHLFSARSVTWPTAPLRVDPQYIQSLLRLGPIY